MSCRYYRASLPCVAPTISHVLLGHRVYSCQFQLGIFGEHPFFMTLSTTRMKELLPVDIWTHTELVTICDIYMHTHTRTHTHTHTHKHTQSLHIQSTFCAMIGINIL